MEQFGLGQLPEITVRYNVAPSQSIAAIVPAADLSGRIFKMFKWGLIPSWSKCEDIGHKMINARAETLDQKPSFREAFYRRRCLIPASGFYEWKKLDKDKQPYFIGLKDRRPFAFAGLWEGWIKPGGKFIESATIVTTTPNALVGEIHNRMPVILQQEDYGKWLDTHSYKPDRVKELLKCYPDEAMMAYAVDKQVNNPRHDDEGCMAAL